MWPFKKKTIQNDKLDVGEQIRTALKSISLPEAQPSWYLGSVGRTDWDVNTAIVEGYNASAIVYACVEKRAKLTAAVPWKAKVKVGGEWEDAPDNHPLSLLLKRPNPDQSFYELIYSASQNLDLSGDAFLTKIRAGVGNRPKELWVIPSKYVRIKPGSVRLVEYYEVDTQGSLTRRRVDSEDMCHLRFPNPSSAYYGQPVLLSGGRATDIDRESGIWQKVSLENRGATDINIKVSDTATQEQVDSIKQQYQKQQAGAKNARKAFVSNADIQQLGQTAVELDFVASRRAVWTEICAIFGMSLANLGMTESVNLANAEAMDKALYHNTIIPNLQLFREQLNRKLAADFGDNVRLDYDLSNVSAMQEGLIDKLDAAQRLHAMGVPMTDINDKLELGLEPRAEYDIGYIASGLIPSSYDVSGEDGTNAEQLGADAYGDQNA